MTRQLTGTPSQIEWAELIRPRVEAEFERVANALRETAARQSAEDRADTGSVLAILEEKRVEAMSNEQAGYYIRDWQELGDQVRKMIGRDVRYQEIRARRDGRRATAGKAGK